MKFKVQTGADLPDELKKCLACHHYYHVVQRVIQYWEMWSQFRGCLDLDVLQPFVSMTLHRYEWVPEGVCLSF